MEWGTLEFRPLSPLSLKPFTSLPMGVHGPGVGASTLSYPAPSTIAGALAAALVNATGRHDIVDKCKNVDDAFGDVDCVLKGLLSQDYRIRSGLVTARQDGYTGLFAYINSGRLISLRSLLDAMSRARVDSSDPSRLPGVILSHLMNKALNVSVFTATGIAVSRASKAVRESMIYNIAKTVYPTDSAILVEVSPAGKLSIINNHVVKLGGEGGIARISVNDRSSVDRIRGSGGEWLLVTTSISLVDTPPFDDVVSSGGALGSLAAEALASRLLEKYTVECGSLDDGRVVYMVKGELSLETVFPGWPAKRDKPRRPYIAVPAGTVVYARAPRSCIERIVDGGVGLYSRLGWGSVVAVSIG